MRHADGRRALTLIEVLVVVTILALLSGMLMSIIGTAGRAAKRSGTQSVMRTIDVALRQFKAESKGYPFQRDYADTAGGERCSNRLQYHLGTTIAAADRSAVHADMDAAAARYGFYLNPWAGPQPASAITYTVNRANGRQMLDGSGRPEGDVAPTGWRHNTFTNTWTGTYEDPEATCMMLNRMAQERARLLMFIGAVDATGPVMSDVSGPAGLVHRGRDASALRVLDAPTSDARPGWAHDYLRGELAKRYIAGEQVLDAWGNPLIYVCQAMPGARGTTAYPLLRRTYIWAPEWYGLAPSGRRTLWRMLPGTNQPMAADGAALPDGADLWRSDRRVYAAPGHEREFELWSAGPDGRFDWMRNDIANRDNVGAADYDRGLR